MNAVGGIMCKVNEKTAETMECKCNQICCKMQNESLRYAINCLINKQYDTKAILGTLEATYNLLSVYSCLPGTCLLERVEWVYQKIIPGYSPLNEDEKIMVNMLISELRAFLNNS